MLSREEFEILELKQKHRYITKQIDAFYHLKQYDEEVYNCELDGCNGNQWLTDHHIWAKSGAPLWYHALFENMIYICGKCHRDIHDNGKVFEQLEKIKLKLQAEDKAFKEKYIFKSK